MKPWMAIVIVIATLAVGLWLMAPRSGPPATARPGGSGVKVSDDKIATISSGQRVEIDPHLKEGRFTIVEFTADW